MIKIINRCKYTISFHVKFVGKFNSNIILELYLGFQTFLKGRLGRLFAQNHSLENKFKSCNSMYSNCLHFQEIYSLAVNLVNSTCPTYPQPLSKIIPCYIH